MLGDDLDPTVTTARVGSGTIFGRAREEGRVLTREVRLDLAVDSELCRWSRAERREDREAQRLFSGDRKRPMLDQLYCRYIYSLGRQTNSDCDETGQAVCLHYNKTTRQLSSHSENIFRPLIKYYFGHAAGACKCVWAQNGQQRELGKPGRIKF